MTVNNAENGINSALINEIKQIRKELNELRTTPQPIGNGSINYAVFNPVTSWGPLTLAAGAGAIFWNTYMDHTLPLTWNGLPAINQATFFDYLVTVYVDALDAAHAYPFGSSLTGGQQKIVFAPYIDYYLSGISSSNGQRTLIIPLTNQDSVSHTYWIQGNALIPRPALKPQ